jgi:hypothetical protein
MHLKKAEYYDQKNAIGLTSSAKPINARTKSKNPFACPHEHNNDFGPCISPGCGWHWIPALKQIWHENNVWVAGCITEIDSDLGRFEIKTDEGHFLCQVYKESPYCKIISGLANRKDIIGLEIAMNLVQQVIYFGDWGFRPEITPIIL